MHQGHGRHRSEIEPLHGLRGEARNAVVFLRRGDTHGSEPIEIGAGLKMPALAFDNDRPQPGDFVESIDRGQHALDKIAVISVVDRGAVEDHGRHLARIDLQQHGAGVIEICHTAPHFPRSGPITNS